MMKPTHPDRWTRFDVNSGNPSIWSREKATRGGSALTKSLRTDQQHQQSMLGTMFYPVARIIPDKKTAQAIPGSIDYQIVYEGVIGGKKLWILENGYIVVDSDDSGECAIICNCLFLAASLLGSNRYYPVYQKEFENVLFDPSASPMFGLTERRLSSIRGASSHFEAVFQELVGLGKPYPASVLATMAGLAGQVHQSAYRDRILLFYNAWHEGNMSNWTPCFILSWMCFEMWVYEEMRLHLNGVKVSKSKQDEILDFGVSQIMLLISAEIDGGRFSQGAEPLAIEQQHLTEGHRLRKIRNRVVHGGETPTERQAEDCRELANKSIWRYFRLSGIAYSDIKKEADRILGREAS